MEAFATIQIVSSIIQLVDFGTKCVAKSAELYGSADGVLGENAEIENATTHLTKLNEQTRDAPFSIADHALQDLCKDVARVSSELIDVLNGLKVHGTKTKWQSLRKAIKSVWGKERVRELEVRLAGFRDTLNLHICVDMRQRLERIDTEVASRFDDCDVRTKEILEAIAHQQDVFRSNLLDHTVAVQTWHAETATQIQEMHENTRLEVHQIADRIEEANEAEHVVTRQEIQQGGDRIIASTTAAHHEASRTVQTAEIRLHEAIGSTDEASAVRHQQTQSQIAEIEQALSQLSQQMQAQEAALRALVTAMGQATNSKKRTLLRERSNAVTAAILALETMYRSLQEILEALQSSVGELIEKARTSDLWQVTKRLSVSTSSRRASEQQSSGAKSPGLTLGLKPYYAHSVYYTYYYRWLDIHLDLVDISVMERKWPLRNLSMHLPHTNFEGVSIDDSKCDSKPVWLLATVNAALMRASLSEAACFELIAETFDKSGHPYTRHNRPYTEGHLASRLRADIGYWRSFATTRGMIVDEVQPTSDLISFNESYGVGQGSECFEMKLEHLSADSIDELVNLLLWLIGSDSEMKVSKSVTVRADGPASRVFKELRPLGLCVRMEEITSNKGHEDRQLVMRCTQPTPNLPGTIDRKLIQGSIVV